MKYKPVLKSIILYFILFSFFEAGCQNNLNNKKVYFGDELLFKENLDLLQNHKIGIVTNHSAVLPNKVHIIDSLQSLEINIKVLFSPEHGIRGENSAGENISSSIDSVSGIHVYSLYGSTKKPSREMLKDIDLILYDIQDVGARFYTYISTLYYVLQSAGENNIPVIILDRPDPQGGLRIGGPVLETNYESYVGIAPIPILYGMTPGELANYFVEENIIKTKNEPVLTVIKMKNWNRNDCWDDFNRGWIPTSPNIPNFETALVYPGTCLIEGTNISEGRGTDGPFLTIGAPFISSDELLTKLNSFKIGGVSYSPITFTPVEIIGKATNPKYNGVECFGIKIKVTDKRNFNAVEFGVHLLYTILNLYPNQFRFKDDYFDLLAGSDGLRKDLLSGKIPAEIINSWHSELNKFQSTRKKYLLY